MKFLKFCCYCLCILNFILLTSVFPMEKKEVVFQTDLDLFFYAINVIENKNENTLKDIEFVKFLVEDGKFYKTFGKKIKDYAQEFKGLRAGDNHLCLGKDSKKEMLGIRDKIQKRYKKWEKQKKEERVKKEKELEEIKKERERVESEFEAANIKFGDAKDIFAKAKKRYDRALEDLKKEKEAIKRKKEEEKNRDEFEAANLEFAGAKTKFKVATEKYEQALKCLENKK